MMASHRHPEVQRYMRIKRNRAPRVNGALALEGLFAIRHAVDGSATVEVVFVCRPLQRGNEASEVVEDLCRAGATVLEVSERTLCRMVDRDGPDGLAAIGRIRPARLTDIPVGDVTRVVVADGLQLPGNLGTVVRCADGAGASGVLLTGGHVRATHPLVVKASTGAVFALPVVAIGREAALNWLRRAGFRIIAADPSALVSYRHANYSGRVAIVVGSERDGLSSSWKRWADVLVSIPMLGVADSLNVGHAAALLLYEALGQQDPATPRDLSRMRQRPASK